VLVLACRARSTVRPVRSRLRFLSPALRLTGGALRPFESDLDDLASVCERRCRHSAAVAMLELGRREPTRTACRSFCRGCATRMPAAGIAAARRSTSMWHRGSVGALVAALEDRIEAVRAAAAGALAEKKVTGSAPFAAASAARTRCFCAGRGIAGAAVSSLHPRRCGRPACAA